MKILNKHLSVFLAFAIAFCSITMFSLTSFANDFSTYSSVDTARDLDLGKVYDGKLSSGDWVDYYVFEITKTTKVYVTGNNFTLAEVTYTDSNHLGSWEYLREIRSNWSEPLMAELTLNKGLYFIKIEGYAISCNYSIRVGQNCFSDVSDNAWFIDSVKYCVKNGYMNGYDLAHFGPGDALKRQDFVVILSRIATADLSSYTSCTLKDVDINAYYGKAVAWAVDQHIISGYDNGNFGVGDPITREQVCTILHRYLKRPAIGTTVSLNKFPDKDRISSFAKDAMVWAVNNRIISGKNGNLAPTATASRAEIATIVMRMDKAGMFSD
jgi:hypothetical protein